MTGQVNEIEGHPFRALIDAGLNVTLNGDDPAMFGSWLADEYEVARTVFGLSDEELARLATAGVRGSFAEASTKVRLEEEILQWLESPEEG
jgi:adenosine deaminase